MSSFLDAPQLQTLVLGVDRSDLHGLVPLGEEIWLHSRSESLDLAEEWEPLLRLCPKLRILKLTDRSITGRSKQSFDFFRNVRNLGNSETDGRRWEGSRWDQVHLSLKNSLLPFSLPLSISVSLYLYLHSLDSPLLYSYVMQNWRCRMYFGRVRFERWSQLCRHHLDPRTRIQPSAQNYSYKWHDQILWWC